MRTALLLRRHRQSQCAAAGSNATAVCACGRRHTPSPAPRACPDCYHLGKAVLLGDAAHSTGGASGQGCNSALQDAAALADLLLAEAAKAASPDAVVGGALLRYSQQRVPEGQALLELSTGPSRTAGPLRRARFALSTAASALLGRVGLGAPPLQTELTTTLASFAEIRRRRAGAYGPFPEPREFEEEIARVVGSAKVARV